MLLLLDAAPLAHTLRALFERHPTSRVAIVAAYLDGTTAIGSIGDDDALDVAHDPGIDREALTTRLVEAGAPSAAARPVADAIADRETVLDLRAGRPPSTRPPTLFEMQAMRDVLGELAALLPARNVRIDTSVLRDGLNHCQMEGDVARIRLLGTNGTTLAGRTHALVHELGHALIGVQRARGRVYRAPYGQPDYGQFLDARTFDRPCDEEALVRALADAWLLRRDVPWARTWPGAIDAVARDLDADQLAAFVRFRLAQGLALPFTANDVRAIDKTTMQSPR